MIVSTGLIYGLTGGPVARALGVARTGPGGVLLIGGSPVARAIGHALQDRGLTVVVWTGDDEGAAAAKSEGLSVYDGNPTENVSSDAPPSLDELEYALAMAEDEALNAMIATDLVEYFGRDRVFQLAVKDKRTPGLLHQGDSPFRPLSQP